MQYHLKADALEVILMLIQMCHMNSIHIRSSTTQSIVRDLLNLPACISSQAAKNTKYMSK